MGYMIVGFGVLLVSCALLHRMDVVPGRNLFPTESYRSPRVLNQEVEILPCGGGVRYPRRRFQEHLYHYAPVQDPL